MAVIQSEMNAIKKFGSKFNFGTAAFAGLNLAFGAMDYKDAREQGYSKMGSIAKAASTFAVGEVLGGWSIPFFLAPAIPELAVTGYEELGKMQRRMSRNGRQVPFYNKSFNDSQQAFTMRQAGMQLAKNSQYNLQQTLMGNEAAYLRQ